MDEDGGKPDESMLETIYLNSFLEKYELKPVWQYGNHKWGSRDASGTFNGVVGMVYTSSHNLNNLKFLMNDRLDTFNVILL